MYVVPQLIKAYLRTEQSSYRSSWTCKTRSRELKRYVLSYVSCIETAYEPCSALLSQKLYLIPSLKEFYRFKPSVQGIVIERHVTAKRIQRYNGYIREWFLTESVWKKTNLCTCRAQKLTTIWGLRKWWHS